MEMIYTESDLLLLIAETERGNWRKTGILKKKNEWVASDDNILCEYASGNCIGNETCQNCLRNHLLQYIAEQEYDYLRNILKRIKERNT